MINNDEQTKHYHNRNCDYDNRYDKIQQLKRVNSICYKHTGITDPWKLDLWHQKTVLTTIILKVSRLRWYVSLQQQKSSFGEK